MQQRQSELQPIFPERNQYFKTKPTLINDLYSNRRGVPQPTGGMLYKSDKRTALSKMLTPEQMELFNELAGKNRRHSV
jgi:hypothetical protein